MYNVCPICDFFLDHLTEIYFLYGLAFFVTGIVVWLEASRSSAIPWAQAMPLLAAFGLVHGIHEWMEMFQSLASAPTPPLLRLIRLVLLILSFMLLVELGIRLLMLGNWPHWPLVRWVIMAVFLGGTLLIWITWRADRQAWISAIDAWCRYTLAVPGAALSAAGLCRQGRCVMNPEANPSPNLRVVGISFLLYGIPGQVFVGPSPLPPSNVVNSVLFSQILHFPVQLHRTIMACLIVVFTVRALRTFEEERQRRVKRLNKARMEAQRQLTEEMKERQALQREMLHRAVQAQEEERRRIARELHDETSQALTGLSLELGALKNLISQQPQRAQNRIDKLQHLTNRVMEDLHHLTTHLRPTMLDELGLVPALIAFADDCSTRFSFMVETEVSGKRRRLPPEMETALYRIAQEALTNVAKHAQADYAQVQLHFGEREVSLEVSDDGVGMDPQTAQQAAVRGEGWGLAGIYERAELMEGQVDLQSAPGAGTQINVRVPISKPTRPAKEKENEGAGSFDTGG